MTPLSGTLHDLVKPSQDMRGFYVFRSPTVPSRPWDKHGLVGLLVRLLLVLLDRRVR